MSKAYCCDGCGELFPGDACTTDVKGNEFCFGCTRVIKAFQHIDPFELQPTPKALEDKPKDKENSK